MFSPILHCNLGLAHEFAGNGDEALRSYRQALTWSAKYEKAKQGVARLSKKKKGFLSRFLGGDK
jgi:hypothetical protein